LAVAEAGSSTISGVERALEVLTLFAESDQATLGVTEIAEQLGYSKAVVHRILTTCRAKGFIEADDSRRYRLGPKFVALGLSYLERVDVRRHARSTLVRLSATTNETATLSIRSGWNRIYVDQVTPDRDVKMVVQLGQGFPLHAGASSKALLAFLGDAEREEYFRQSNLARLTDLTITDPTELRLQVDEIRQTGYARSMGERHAGAGSVAAPIFGPREEPLAVVSVAGPVDRFRGEADRFVDLLLDAARALSAEMGGAAHHVGGDS
jgi:IclR family transcriptional regulator, acetate operon repressor